MRKDEKISDRNFCVLKSEMAFVSAVPEMHGRMVISMKIKKSVIVVIAIVAILFVFPVAEVNLCRARLHYHRYGTDIDVKLSKEETELIRKVVKKCDFTAYSSCGYDIGVSVSFGLQYFCFATDSCNGLQYNIMFYDIPEEDAAQIHEIFEKYGGHFPCC